MKPSVSLALRLVAIAVLCAATAFEAVPLGAVVITTLPACENPMIDSDCGEKSEIKLLQPLDDETETLKVGTTPLEAFFKYFNMSWPWLLGVASGVAVLQAVWGGILIMTSWDQDGGKEKIQWALGGMVMIALAGFILRFLNPLFFE